MELPGFYFDPIKKRYFPLSLKPKDSLFADESVPPGSAAKWAPKFDLNHFTVASLIHTGALFTRANRTRIEFVLKTRAVSFEYLSFPNELSRLDTDLYVPERNFGVFAYNDTIRFVHSILPGSQVSSYHGILSVLSPASTLDTSSRLTNIHRLPASEPLTILKVRANTAYFPVVPLGNGDVAMDFVTDDRLGCVYITNLETGAEDTWYKLRRGKHITALSELNGKLLVGLTGGDILVLSRPSQRRPFQLAREFRIEGSAVKKFIKHPLKTHFLALSMHGDLHLFGPSNLETRLLFPIDKLPFTSKGILDDLEGLLHVGLLYVFYRGKKEVIAVDLLGLGLGLWSSFATEQPILQLLPLEEDRLLVRY
jgi:hypothetical protein